MKTVNNTDAIVHTTYMKDELKKLSDHLRSDIKAVNDIQAKALFEVAAEVLDGLRKAFADFERKEEPAWQ